MVHLINRSTINRINATSRNVKGSRRPAPPNQIASTTPFLLARIVNWTFLAPNRWTYQWVRAELPTATSVGERAFVNRGGWEGTAINIIEGMNTAGAAGPGVSTAGLPGTFALQPVQGYVMLFNIASEDGEPVWVFAVPNAIDGACDTPLTAEFDYGDYIAGSYLSDDFGDFDAPVGDNDLGFFGVVDGGTFALVDFDYDFLNFATGGSAANYLFGSFN